MKAKIQFITLPNWQYIYVGMYIVYIIVITTSTYVLKRMHFFTSVCKKRKTIKKKKDNELLYVHIKCIMLYIIIKYYTGAKIL